MELKNDIKSHILQLQEAARQNRLVIFVGAGVSASAGVPVWKELVEMFRDELPEGVYDPNDILKSAQIYRELRGDVEYLKKIKQILKDGQTCSNQLHKSIMQLNPCHIVTTNYDDLLEQAALNNNKQYYVVAKDAHLPANQGERMIVKMHGDFKEGNIVLTENDYFDYSRNFPLIRSFLLSLFSTKVVLFIGFSFDDINLKYILREVAGILDSRMQRVYLLEDNDRSSLAYEYFHRKGIQILNIPKEVSGNLLKSQGKTNINEGLTGDKSVALNQALQLIRLYDPHYDDLIGKTIDFLKKYDDQVRFWGKYLKYVFPEDQRSGFEISQCSLSLPYVYQKEFKKRIKNPEYLKAMREKYGFQYDWLLKKLHSNRILSVGSHILLDTETAKLYDTESMNDALNIVYSLSIANMEERMNELRYKPLRYSIDDLELPYLLFKLGDYAEAYQIYRDLAPEFWKRRKYVLYYLSLYNAKAISVKVLNKNIGVRGFDYSKFQSEINDLRIGRVLDELPIEAPIKELLGSLESGDMLKSDWIETAKLNDQLQEQRRSAERGGMSLNSNIARLLDSFVQTFYFCNENYILNECYSYTQDSYTMMAKGILNSIMTPESEAGMQSKLDSLTQSNALLLVFMVKTDELKKILNSLIDSPIPAEQEFIDILLLQVNNLREDAEKHVRGDLMQPELIGGYLKNIILLLNRIENAPHVEKIYLLINRYWIKGRFADFATEILRLIDRQTPTAEEAVTILDNILQENHVLHISGIQNLVTKCASIADKEGIYIQNVPSLERMDKISDIVLRSAFLCAFPPDLRKDFVERLRKDVKNLFELTMIECRTNAHVITKELLADLKSTIAHDDHHHFYTEELTSSILKQMAQKDEYRDLHEELATITEVSECYRFMCSPLHYDKGKEIKGSWLMYLDDDDLLPLLEDNKIRKIIGDFCKRTRWNDHFKNRVDRLLGLEGEK